MNDQLRRSLLDAMTQYVINAGIPDVVKVTSFEETQESGGYCETCWDSWTEVTMIYDKIMGGTGTHTFYGSLAEFIRDLTY